MADFLRAIWYNKAMNKREMIERALRQFFKMAEVTTSPPIRSVYYLDADALAEQAIVIECEVEHLKDTGGLCTIVEGDKVPVPENLRPIPMLNWQASGHHGTPGKALAIIISVGEKK